MTELKPCPFCGGEAQLARDVTCGYETFWAFCADCHAQANYGHSQAEAVDAWNARADDRSEAAAYWRRLYEETVLERTCTIEHRRGEYVCTACGNAVGDDDPWNELYINGNAIELWEYCPNCGAKVVEE